MSTSRFTTLPAAVDLAACVATQAAPPQPFAPSAESPEVSWAQVQQDVDG